MVAVEESTRDKGVGFSAWRLDPTKPSLSQLGSFGGGARAEPIRWNFAMQVRCVGVFSSWSSWMARFGSSGWLRFACSDLSQSEMEGGEWLFDKSASDLRPQYLL